MAVGTIVHASRNATTATLAVRVEGDSVGLEGRPVAVEYTATTSRHNPDGTLKGAAALRAELLALVKAQREVTLATPPVSLGIVGEPVEL